MATKILLRRDYARNWLINNPELSPGEIGYELDTGKFKWGMSDFHDNHWNRLPYFHENPTIQLNTLIANQLAVPRKIELTGHVTGSAFFDGSSNVAIVTQLATNSYSWSMISNKPTVDITLSGDVIGFGTSVELGAVTISTSIASTIGQYLTWNNIRNKPSPKITLVGDVEGEAVMNELNDVVILTRFKNPSLTF